MIVQRRGLISRAARRLAVAGALTLALGAGGVLVSAAPASAARNEAQCTYHETMYGYWYNVATIAWNNNYMQTYYTAVYNMDTHFAGMSYYC
ncbi:hypothetical protein ACTMTJ_00885 [Phytohabitans sp. LJ34]|uniref:hypothetical protein n=1 Tax=Phytohabitans sp. LJ34 TaxID=3452217 RepID=UPI003F891638